MKNVSLKVFGLFLILTLLTSKESLAQIELSGSWSATCIVEKTTASSISFCDFCTISPGTNNTEIRFEPFEMDFEKEHFILTINNKSTKVYYKINENLDNLSFTYNEKDYEFKILPVWIKGEQNYILKEVDGMLIFLENKAND